MKYIFIVNESAGRGRYKKILPNVETACKARNIEFEIRYITKAFQMVLSQFGYIKFRIKPQLKLEKSIIF